MELGVPLKFVNAESCIVCMGVTVHVSMCETCTCVSMCAYVVYL